MVVMFRIHEGELLLLLSKVMPALHTNIIFGQELQGYFVFGSLVFKHQTFQLVFQSVKFDFKATTL